MPHRCLSGIRARVDCAASCKRLGFAATRRQAAPKETIGPPSFVHHEPAEGPSSAAATRESGRACVGKERGRRQGRGNDSAEEDREAAPGFRRLAADAQAGERALAALKAAAQAHYAKEHPEIVLEIDKGLAKLDDLLDNVDHRLADSLALAGQAKDESGRNAELKNAKTILTEYIGYVKSEPLVAHMDQNPFGVKTDLRTLLAGGLTDAAKAIG